jgi:hypothetical protein
VFAYAVHDCVVVCFETGHGLVAYVLWMRGEEMGVLLMQFMKCHP